MPTARGRVDLLFVFQSSQCKYQMFCLIPPTNSIVNTMNCFPIYAVDECLNRELLPQGFRRRQANCCHLVLFSVCSGATFIFSWSINEKDILSTCFRVRLHTHPRISPLTRPYNTYKHNPTETVHAGMDASYCFFLSLPSCVRSG